MGRAPLSLEELRDAMADAVRARAWAAVEALQWQIDDLERTAVVDLAAERARREAVR